MPVIGAALPSIFKPIDVCVAIVSQLQRAVRHHGFTKSESVNHSGDGASKLCVACDPTPELFLNTMELIRLAIQLAAASPADNPALTYVVYTCIELLSLNVNQIVSGKTLAERPGFTDAWKAVRSVLEDLCSPELAKLNVGADGTSIQQVACLLLAKGTPLWYPTLAERARILCNLMRDQSGTRRALLSALFEELVHSESPGSILLSPMDEDSSAMEVDGGAPSAGMQYKHLALHALVEHLRTTAKQALADVSTLAAVSAISPVASPPLRLLLAV
jgi:hypothetical protein